MDGPVTPEEAIEAIRGIGGAQPGCRALHAKGTLYRGSFTAVSEAQQFSRAQHLDGSVVPALIRFSNGAGNPKQRDSLPQVRGMAVKLTLRDGSTTDISTQTARLFTSSTPRGFVDLMRAMRPGLAAPARLVKYIAGHPRLLGAFPVLRDGAKVPASYATADYHGLHAFRWVNSEDKGRYVRYHLCPAAGEQSLSLRASLTAKPNFLVEELNARLAEAPVRFLFRIQIAGPNDSTTDPSAPWASTEFVTVGMLEIVGLEAERESGDDIVVFDPMRVSDGIEPSDDPVLWFRTRAYSASVKLRTGVDRGPEAPNG
jgi:catalase